MTENKQPCTCTQAATDLLKAISPIKEGVLKEVKCEGCGKIFWTNEDTDLCLDCRKGEYLRI